MFPPLCFVDMSTGIVPNSSKDTLNENLPEEEFALISKTNSAHLFFKFKLIELLNEK